MNKPQCCIKKTEKISKKVRCKRTPDPSFPRDCSSSLQLHPWCLDSEVLRRLQHWGSPPTFLRIALLVLATAFFFTGSAAAGDQTAEDIAPRYGLAVISGNPFDPVSNIHFVQLSAFGIWDYDKVWHHRAPEAMRFKVEVNAGATFTPNIRTVLSTEMMALYYFKSLSTPRLAPFISTGIGLIYTDFQTGDKGPPPEEMGSRINFNPQIGIGTEINVQDGPPFFAEFRMSHISNADLNDDNRGLNSVVFLFGRFF